MNSNDSTINSPEATAAPSEWVRHCRERVNRKKKLFVRLPGGGRVHIDRPLPFLCLYRHPRQPMPEEAEQLVTSQAAYAIARSGRDRRIVGSIANWWADEIVQRFGAILILEVWLESSSPLEKEQFRTNYRPEFTVRYLAAQEEKISSTATILEKSLGRVRVQQQQAAVTIEAAASPAPPDLPPVSRRQRGASQVFQLGMKVRPVFVNAATGGVFPLLFEDLREQVSVALKETFFEFDRGHTTHGSSHFHALGRRSITQAVLQADEALEDCSSSFQFLLQVTPTNTEAAWKAYKRSGFARLPRFLYRPLDVDPELIKRRIYSLPLERIEDPTLKILLRRKREELDRQVTMLFDRETPRFLHGSLQLFGGVEPELLQLAQEILSGVPPVDFSRRRQLLSAQSFARSAAMEIDFYQKQHSGFSATVEIRDDIPTGVMVSGSRLLIGAGTTIESGRASALLQHEVGTHLLTFFNGAAQPLRQLRSGLAGYEELQEGLATFSEYLAGGFSPGRLRLLAARVVAVHCLVDGASFHETFRLLQGTHGLAERPAFLAVMRVFRGGGFTKDALYLRGLRDLLDYLRGGGELPPLLVGKIAFDHIPIIEELRERHVVRPAPVLPRYLQTDQAAQRLAAARRGLPILKMIQPIDP
jgi:uncharacterized protein (TIGR02421 family)